MQYSQDKMYIKTVTKTLYDYLLIIQMRFFDTNTNIKPPKS